MVCALLNGFTQDQPEVPIRGATQSSGASSTEEFKCGICQDQKSIRGQDPSGKELLMPCPVCGDKTEYTDCFDDAIDDPNIEDMPDRDSMAYATWLKEKETEQLQNEKPSEAREYQDKAAWKPSAESPDMHVQLAQGVSTGVVDPAKMIQILNEAEKASGTDEIKQYFTTVAQLELLYQYIAFQASSLCISPAVLNAEVKRQDVRFATGASRTPSVCDFEDTLDDGRALHKVKRCSKRIAYNGSILLQQEGLYRW